MEFGQLYIILACIIGIAMAWGVGANDLANIMSTTMGSKAVSVRQAIAIAIIFEFAGAFLGSGDVTNTIRSGIINTALLPGPDILIHGMLAVLLAGTTWMLIASYLGLPVSITNAIIGSIVGFGSIVIGISAIQWQQVSIIAISWLCSPSIAGIIAYALLVSIQGFILGANSPLEKAKRYLPFYLLLVGLVLAYMTIFKGLKHFDLALDIWVNVGIAIFTAIVVVIAGMRIIEAIPFDPDSSRRDRFVHIEKMFGVLVAFTACAMVFAHGSNDIAIAVGPMSVVVSTVTGQDHILQDNGLMPWILFLGSGGVIAGFVMYGRKVIETVGSGITTLTPTRAFAATLSAATTVIISTSIGIPVSATQTLVGAVLGVGLARGIGALNLTVIRNIFMSWIVTLPAASLLAICYFYLFKAIFSS